MGSPALVERVASTVADALATERVRRRRSGQLGLATDDERQLARAVAVRELESHAAETIALGKAPLESADERDVIDSVLAAVLGLGRIQPMLDDADITDIHVRGTASAWVKLRDGSRREMEPVVRSDDELVQLVRLVATRLGRSERRFDTAHPELNLQLPDGSRLFAAMEVSSHPTVVVRKGRCARCTPTPPRRCFPSSRPTWRWRAPACRWRRSTCSSRTPSTSSSTWSRSTGCAG